MTIRHFQIFKAVCDWGGVTAAAERLNITQPTVSIAIHELEAFYNTKLFDRMSRKIYLTEEGELLRHYVERVLSECDEVTAILRHGKLLPKCRLGVNVSFAETHLSGIISKIKTALPGCDLHVTVRDNEQLEHLLSDNKIDFAIYDGTNDRSSKDVSFMFKETLVAVCTKDFCAPDTIDMKTLAQYPLLLREVGSGVRIMVDRAFHAKELAQIPFVESISTMSLVALAEQGMGFAFVPPVLAERVCKNKRMKQIDITDGDMFRVYYLAHNKNKHLTEAMVAVKSIICDKPTVGHSKQK